MALTYLNSQMIEVPAAIANLSAGSLQVSNLSATNLVTPTLGNATEWNTAYTLVRDNSASWEESADITAITTTVATNSANWNAGYGTVNALSANWNSVYTTVNTLSNAWEESADIVPTVVNYLSTSNVQVNDITFAQAGTNIFNSAEIFGDVIVHGSLSALSGAQIFQVVTSTTSSLSVENYGTGPALLVFQNTSLESVAQFKGANGTDILTINNVDLDQGQDGVKVYFTGSGNTFVVGNSANNTALVVTSAGDVNTSGQLLSGNTPLHNIFLTAETDSQTLTYDESTYEVSISNGNTVSLSSLNTTLAQNSAKWEDVYTTVNTLSTDWEESADITAITTTVQSNSANWDSAYAITTALSSDLWNDVYTNVQLNSASWEESADILPTVTNYLSTEHVAISSLNVTEQLLSANNDLFSLFLTPANTLTTSICAMSGDGLTPFVMQFTNGLLTTITL